MRVEDGQRRDKFMIKLFKNVDEKLAEIGFIKIEENKYGVVYTRKMRNTNILIRSV